MPGLPGGGGGDLRNGLNAFYADTRDDIFSWGVASICSSILLLLLYAASSSAAEVERWGQWELSTGRVAPWGRLKQVPPDEDSSMDVWPFYLPPGSPRL